MLVVDGVLGEQAQVEAGACPARVLDDDVGTVKDVGGPAVVSLVEVVDALPAGGEDARRLFVEDEIHQVEVMASLLDQGAARVGGEAVPVSHLGIEGFAVLANRHLVQMADAAFMRDADHLRHRRHVAVFLRHPDNARAAPGPGDQLDAVGDPGHQRLLAQDV